MYGPTLYMYPDTILQRYDRYYDDCMGKFCARRGTGRGERRCVGAVSAMAPHYMVLDSLGQHRLEADVASIDEILNKVADSALLNSQERCILAWELSTALGDPSYGTYRR